MERHDKAGRDAVNLARKLLLGYTLYFSRGVLNSEGRKVFEEMSRSLLASNPGFKKSVRKARKRPTLENIYRICEKLLGAQCKELVRASVEGPYTYWPTHVKSRERAGGRGRGEQPQ